MFKKILMIFAFTFVLGSASVFAKCAFKNDVPIKMISNSFEAWKAVTDAMKECGNVEAQLDNEIRQKQPAAFATDPALYQIGGLTTSTILNSLNSNDLLQLDDLVAKYGKQLKPNQLIKFDGKIMAIAMMVNNQHLMYREDILKKLKIKEPTNYNQVLKAAEKIKQAKVVEYPLGGTYKTGWNLGEEFINMYLAYDGKFFGKSGRATINNKKGVRTLEMMKKLTEYMDPEYLTADSTYVQKQFQQGKIAMANFWASRAGAMDDPKESTVVGKIKMAKAPSAKRGGKPASTLWWDGLAFAKNMSPKQADAAFRVAMEGIDKEMVQANNDTAVWLIDGYKPGRISEGAIATANGGAPNYPASARMGVMHTVLGNNLSDYFTGKKSARETLKAISNAYKSSAKESGILK